MSYSIDVDILLYASARSSPLYERAKSFLDECASNLDGFYLSWQTIFAYLRMSTHTRIVDPPLSQAQAQDNIEALLALPQVRTIAEQEGFWELYCASIEGLAVRNKLVPDAHLAALLRQHGVKTIYTNDSDFRKFGFLDVRNPLSSGD